MSFFVVTYYENINDTAGALYTVPSGWVTQDSKYLYYPRSSAVERKLVSRIDSIPDFDNWKRAECRIRKKGFATYNEAILFEEEISNFTDTESEDRHSKMQSCIPKNNRRPMKHHVKSDANAKMHNQYDNILKGAQVSLPVDENQNSPTTASLPFDPNNNLSTTANELKNMLREIILDYKTNFAACHVKIDNLSKKVDKLIDINEKILEIENKKVPAGEANNIIEGFEFPIQSAEDIISLNQILADTVERNKIMPVFTAYFSRFKTQTKNMETNCHITCKLVVDAIISPEAQCTFFTWSGRKAKNTENKLAFKNIASHIVDFVYTLLLKMDPSYNLNVFHTRMNNILKSAKSRTRQEKISRIKKDTCDIGDEDLVAYSPQNISEDIITNQDLLYDQQYTVEFLEENSENCQ